MCKSHSNIFLCTLVMAIAMMSCRDGNDGQEPDAPGTYRYTESFDNFPNPERGFFTQHYYEGDDLSDKITPEEIAKYRKGEWKGSLYLHSYYMTPYINGGDLSQAFLDRLAANMQTLRANGAKCVLRFSYSHDDPTKKGGFVPGISAPSDAKPEVTLGHIEQLKPYLQEYADVIFCMQAGFIGTWGEWYYTTHYGYGPSSDEDYKLRWQLADALMDALPASRQIGFRYVALKQRYCKMHNLPTEPLTESEAHKGDVRSRWAAHNDAFVSSDNDLGTYRNEADREFLAQDSRYIVTGGESCNPKNYYSRPDRAIATMERFHWTYLNNSYHLGIITEWRDAGRLDEIKRRLGYRFVLDKAVLTVEPKAGQPFKADLTIRNVGFAACVNARDVELIFVAADNAADKHVFKQSADPRFWMGGETTTVHLEATLDAQMKGKYNVYLNLPDPYATLHDNPKFSIRLANTGIWEEATGYNKLAQITVQ